MINVAGNLAPMFAALVAMPVMLHGLGSMRMGLFTLALGLFGFSGIFDLGLGRALTRSVAFHTNSGADALQLAQLVRKGLLAVLALGVVWGALTWGAADWLVGQVPSLPPELVGEGRSGVRMLALLIPVALLSTSLTGVLEGLQLFDRSNLVRAPVGVATFLAPAVVAQVAPSLLAVVTALAVVRLSGLLALLCSVCLRVPLAARASTRPLPAAPMWRYTGWLTISNIVGPLMVYGDRYYLAASLPASVISFYTIPLDTFFRATAIPGAALGAAFPALTDAHAKPGNVRRFVADAMALLAFAWVIPLVVASILLPDLLRFWLGEGNAAQMVTTSRLILVGVLVNGFALVPFTLLQAVGRADLTAKFHAAELPLFLLALVGLTGLYGIAGAAMAWSFRVLLDAVLLVWASCRMFPHQSGSFLRQAFLVAIAAITVLGSGLVHEFVFRAAMASTVSLMAAVQFHRRGGFSWLFRQFGAKR